MSTTSSTAPRQERLVHDDVLGGLLAPRKTLPCRLLYDARGAELFEQICTLDEYYPTRTELALLGQHLPALSEAIGAEARVIEPGSGAGVKTRMLLQALERPIGYVPIDISREQLEVNARALREEFPGLEVQPVCADYMAAIELPHSRRRLSRSVAFFPGSTIGNFEPDEARAFLARLAHLVGRDGMLLLGADANNDRESLVRAYDDGLGVTAAFDKNVLTHVNRTHDATFDLDAFTHRAVWDASHHRIEMHLVSIRAQTVRVGKALVRLARGESIVTEHCYKHPRASMAAMLAETGWRVRRVDADARDRMHLWLATRTCG